MCRIDSGILPNLQELRTGPVCKEPEWGRGGRAGTFDPRRPRQIASWGVFIALAGGIFAWIGYGDRRDCLDADKHLCRTSAIGRGFAERISAGSHCHEAGGMTSISSGEIICNQSVGWPRERPWVTRPPSERLDRAAPTFPAQAKAGRASHGGLFQAIESTSSFAIVVFSTPDRSDI